MSRRQRQRSDNADAGDHAGWRNARLQRLVQEEVNLMLANDLRDPRLAFVRVTMVELSRDGARARLWISRRKGPSPDDRAGDEAALAGLDAAAGLIRVRLSEALGLKRTPDLRFRKDPSTHVFEESPGAEEDRGVEHTRGAEGSPGAEDGRDSEENREEEREETQRSQGDD